MSISIEEVKKLRDQTGISIMQCKKALEEAEGDFEKAVILLRKQSKNAAAKKADRELGAGAVRSYIHGNNLVGALVELTCETDFVAKNQDFIDIADGIAMHITAMDPAFLSNEDITDEVRSKVTEVMQEEVAGLDKPQEIKAKILEGKLNDYFAEKVLLDQSFVKDPEKTIRQLVEEGTQKLGERIVITRFTRFSISS